MAGSTAMPLWFSILSAGLTFLGTAGGFLSAQFVELKRTERDREARAEARNTEIVTSARARRVALKDRSNEFQHETLLSLQEAALNFLNVSLTPLGHMGAALTQGNPQPDILNGTDALFHSLFRFRTLISRVRDAEVRRLASSLIRANPYSFPHLNREHLEAETNKFADRQRELSDRIGEVLRNLDEEETAGDHRQTD